MADSDKFVRRDDPSIEGVPEKLAPADADVLLINDSEDGGAPKKVQIQNLPASVGFDPDRLLFTTDGGLIYDNDGVLIVKEQP